MINRKSKALGAVEEAKRLLHGIRFSHPEGAYVRGVLASVAVSGGPGTEQGTLTIFISCYRPGHLLVDWQGLAVFLQEEPEGACWLSFLDSSGKAAFHVSRGPSDEFSISSTLTAAELKEFHMPVSLSGSSDISAGSVAVVASSFDALVAARMVLDESGALAVEFRTRDAFVAAGIVHLECLNSEGSVQIQGEAPFESEGQSGWVAHFQTKGDNTAGLSFRFAVRHFTTVKLGM